MTIAVDLDVKHQFKQTKPGAFDVEKSNMSIVIDYVHELQN